jgi:hypothetical protein
MNPENKMEHRALDRPRNSKKNAKRVSESGASRGLETKCQTGV